MGVKTDKQRVRRFKAVLHEIRHAALWHRQMRAQQIAPVVVAHHRHVRNGQRIQHMTQGAVIL